MEIQQHFIKFKFHIIFGVLLSVSFFTILSIAPRFVDLLVYFWPLLASTALFLTVVLVFSRVSPPATDGPGDKAAEGLLDYVAGQTEVITETYTHD